MRRSAGVLALLGCIVMPTFVSAFPFGGQASFVAPCYNGTIFARLGPPRGGDFVWVPTTKTYPFGVPTHVGQWLLGLASAPYFCLLSVQPVVVIPAIAIDMMGSSGPAGAPYNVNWNTGMGGTGSGFSGLPSGGGGVPGGGGTGQGGSTGVGRVLISEVHYRPDSLHGGTSLFGWIELFNSTQGTLDFSGWTLKTATSTYAFPSGTTLGQGQYLLVSGTTTIRSLWNISPSVSILPAPALFVPGSSTGGDVVSISNSTGVVDAMSWGTNTSGFSPSLPTTLAGYALIRTTLGSDTDTASDWTVTSQPLPGK